MGQMIYLATPYFHKSPIVRQIRHDQVTFAAATMMRCGYQVFSPITYGHNMALSHELPKNYAFWKESAERHIPNCTQLVILLLAHWKKSVGVNDEIKLAREHDVPIIGLEWSLFLDTEDMICKQLMLLLG